MRSNNGSQLNGDVLMTRRFVVSDPLFWKVWSFVPLPSCNSMHESSYLQDKEELSTGSPTWGCCSRNE